MHTTNNAKSVSPSFIPCSQKFEFVPEWADDFLALFPHRGSFLWAEHPAPGDRPQWQTETRHLLSDRLILQGAYLYGVRFGKETNYIMLDIDARSAYHPRRDPFAIGRILEALEPLGLYKPVAVRSSYSDGIHLYFPFVLAQSSWRIAQAVASLLESKGLKIKKGQIELFPNARRMSGADYNGHRLPLQEGSYLLNDDFQPIYGTQDNFVKRWRFAQNHNSVRGETVNLILKKFERKASKKLGVSAQKFLNDLNAEIEPGWTGFSQTNYLLGAIARREFIFYHALYGGPPLRGGSLWTRIIEVAIHLPGYEQWCRHQHELEALAFDWCRSIESSHYYPYGGDSVSQTDGEQLHPNQQRALEARERIQSAVAELSSLGELPPGARARNEALRAFGISSQTLYKNLDLWHPKALRKTLEPAPRAMIQAVAQKEADPRSLEPAPRAMIQAVAPISLSTDLGDAPLEQSPRQEIKKAVGGSGGFSTDPPTPEGAAAVKLLIDRIAQQSARRRFTPPPDETIPDEHYFQQLEVALWRV